MIDREKVIKKAERIICSTVDRDMIDSFCEDVIDLLKEQECLQECLKEKCLVCPHCCNCDVDENGKISSPSVGVWISVKDRLPEESGNVLVCVKLDYADGARYAQMCHYSAYKKQFGCFDTSENSGIQKYGVVTHWMPMPELPKDGDA